MYLSMYVGCCEYQSAFHLVLGSLSHGRIHIVQYPLPESDGEFKRGVNNLPMQANFLTVLRHLA